MSDLRYRDLNPVHLDQRYYWRSAVERASGPQWKDSGLNPLLLLSFKIWVILFTLHCSNSLICMHEYLVIDSGG